MSIPGFTAAVCTETSRSAYRRPTGNYLTGPQGIVPAQNCPCGSHTNVYPCGSNPDGTVIWCQQEVCDPCPQPYIPTVPAYDYGGGAGGEGPSTGPIVNYYTP